MDSGRLKVFAEAEWRVKKHGKERCRIWRKRHLSADTDRIACAGSPQNKITDAEVLPGGIRQTHRKISATAADGAYDTRLCQDKLRRKKISAPISPATVPLRISG
ncbi:hypothetical protein B6E78_15320 [Edwardsiella ictaluri]|nr:hypothetical protein B6E78_15320 [Edwardsiella ictaluri]